jgi:hypothetical protein
MTENRSKSVVCDANALTNEGVRQNPGQQRRQIIRAMKPRNSSCPDKRQDMAGVKPSDAPTTTPTPSEDWGYKVDRFAFFPIRPPVDWDDDQDLQEYEDRFGKTENLLLDSRSQLEHSWQKVDEAFVSGICYFLQKRGTRHLAPVSDLTLRGKIELFTELLPVSSHMPYMLRFTTTLARILWLELEQDRILAQRDGKSWVFPLYELADCVTTVAFELKEALRCEHDDFDEACVAQFEAHNVPQPCY